MPLKCWDHETIVNHITDLYHKGVPLYSSYVHQHYPTLHRAGFRYFGNWEAAITAAELDYDEIARYQRWTRKRIITKLRELHRAGEDLSWRQFSLGPHSSLAYAAVSKRHFSSWENALQAAGIAYEDVSRYLKWTPERIQERILAWHADGKPLAAKHIQQDFPGLYHAACRQFSSWRAAIESAGLSYSAVAYRVQRTRQEVVILLGNLKEQGVELTDTHMRRHYPAVHASAIRHFGNWTSARRTVGVDHDFRRTRAPRER
jgi:hypothetical protein